jgi:uncharacterized protein YjbJ (UPF0337 family)
LAVQELSMIRHAFLLLAASAALAACGDTSGGSAQKTGGEVKEAAGSVLGDKSLEREGEKDQAVGGVKEAASDVKEAVKDAAD